VLREITTVRQDAPGLRRRWFQDAYFDLFLWLQPDGELAAFQLSYDRSGDECLLAWHRDHGYRHYRVDSGEDGPFANMTPLLMVAGRFPKFRVVSEFDARSTRLDEGIRRGVRAKLVHYLPAARRQRWARARRR